MEALYPQETRDLEIIDVCAGTGLVAEKVENPQIKLFNQCKARMAINTSQLSTHNVLITMRC